MVGLAGLHPEAAKACELTGMPLYLVGFGAGRSGRPGRSAGTDQRRSGHEPGGDIRATATPTTRRC